MTLCSGAILALYGCATFESADHVQRGSPRFFAGARLDLAAIAADQAALEHFRQYGMRPPEFPRADLVFSAVADGLMLPIVASYTLTEPLLYEP